MSHDSVISACDMALPLNPLVVFLLLLFWGGLLFTCFSYCKFSKLVYSGGISHEDNESQPSGALP